MKSMIICAIAIAQHMPNTLRFRIHPMVHPIILRDHDCARETWDMPNSLWTSGTHMPVKQQRVVRFTQWCTQSFGTCATRVGHLDKRLPLETGLWVNIRPMVHPIILRNRALKDETQSLFIMAARRCRRILGHVREALCI